MLISERPLRPHHRFDLSPEERAHVKNALLKLLETGHSRDKIRAAQVLLAADRLDHDRDVADASQHMTQVRTQITSEFTRLRVLDVLDQIADAESPEQLLENLEREERQETADLERGAADDPPVDRIFTGGEL